MSCLFSSVIFLLSIKVLFCEFELDLIFQLQMFLSYRKRKLFSNKNFPLILVICIIFFLIDDLNAQDVALSDEERVNEVKKRKDLPYFFDDIMIIGGVNRSGLYMSNEFRSLNYGNGFNIGLEGFTPLGKITFIDYGIHFTQRSFFHDRNSVQFRNNYLDFPLYVSYSLPELTSINWRFFLGTQFTYLLSSNQIGNYLNDSQVNFQFDPNRFKRFDFGLNFGLSAEVKYYFFRVRSYIGANNLDSSDQGSMNSFYMEFGYFLFRKYRK